MLRWIAVLCVFCLLTGLLGFGVIPTTEAGLAQMLFFCFTAMLGVSLVVGIVRG